jgi:hypothetical protein
MKKIALLFLVVTMLCFTSASGCGELEDPAKKNEDFQIFQTCNNCTFCDFIFFTPSNPYGDFYNADTDNNWRYYKNLTSGNFSELGVYRWDYICGNVAENLTGCIETKVTSSGGYFNEAQPIAILSQIGFIALLTVLGFSFRKEKWKLKSFFFISALLMALVMLNSINMITGSSDGLYDMGQMGLVIGIVIVAIMIAYFLINYTIEVSNYFKKKKKEKWSNGDYE